MEITKKDVGVIIAIIGAIMAVAKTYYVVPTELQHQRETIQDIKMLVKELDLKVDGIDNAITHNNRDMVHFTNEIGEIKGIMREIQKKQ